MNPGTQKLNLHDEGKTEVKAVLTSQATCLGILETTISHFALNREPQKISLLRIGRHRVEQATERNDIMTQLNQLKDIFILKKFFNPITATCTSLCILNGRRKM